MKLIVRADDFGITDSVTWGALRALTEGIATSSGVMTNMPSAATACTVAREHPELCFGQDINIATGPSVAPAQDLPTMVDASGNFRRSSVIRPLIAAGEEPFPYHEVRLEIEAQVDRFRSLVGRDPAYLNGHAFRSSNFSRALEDVADEYGLICMDRVVAAYDLEARGFAGSGRFAQGWYRMPFEPVTQLETDAEQFFLDHIEELMGRDYSYIICHPGYVSTELMACSSLNIVRMRDLEMCLSSRVRAALAERTVELISITQFCEEQGVR